MAGIYIHIPFCKQACVYCNFHFSTSLKLKDQLISAIIAEIHQRKQYLKYPDIQSIYFGGGTPSLLDTKDIEKILNTLSLYFKWDPTCEITLEANPDDITAEKITAYMKMGINRLSIGIQSFHEEDLRFMTRAHNASQAEDCVKITQDSGLRNITIDLIYGCPTTDDEMWLTNLEKVNSLEIPHLSCYALTVESKTALHFMIKSGKILPPQDSKAIKHFEMLMDFAEINNFTHYEISNFAQSGFIAIHNTNYWKSLPYLGIGPSAHSYDRNNRSWNIANNAQYFELLNQNKVAFESELLSPEDQYNEYVMTRLRTIWGVNIDEMSKTFDEYFIHHFTREIKKPVSKSWVIENENNYRLSRAGKLFADRIASDLFI